MTFYILFAVCKIFIYFQKDKNNVKAKRDSLFKATYSWLITFREIANIDAHLFFFLSRWPPYNPTACY